MMWRKLFFVGAAFVVVSQSARATVSDSQLAEWKLDRAHSAVTFSVSHMVISEVMGTFKEFDITLKAAKEDFTDGVVEAVIKVASINTDNERRDNHLKSDDFFNAEQFPEIRFTSSAIEKLDESNYKIHGDLTIRNVTRRVTFDATLNGKLRLGKLERTGWKATLVIDRFDYGLKWDRTIETGGLVAGREVRITVNVEFTRPIVS
jgi:polyisoprenoid-binding protein YceI